MGIGQLWDFFLLELFGLPSELGRPSVFRSQCLTGQMDGRPTRKNELSVPILKRSYQDDRDDFSTGYKKDVMLTTSMMEYRVRREWEMEAMVQGARSGGELQQ